MKTLIVMPRLKSGWFVEVVYSIGVAAVSAYVKHMGHNVVCLNLNKPEYTDPNRHTELIYDFIKNEKLDIVAVGGLVTQWEPMKVICDAAKMANPGISTIIGGGLVDYSPEEAMAIISSADYGVIGEGEVTTHELLAALENKASVENIEGIIFRDKAKGLVITEKRNPIEDLDTLPFLDYEGFGLFGEISRTKSFAISSSRSCSFGCTYCTHSGGGKYRQRSIAKVFEEIDYVVSYVPDVKNLTIYDELFASSKERLEKFCSHIAPYKINWVLPIRADSVKDPAIFKSAYAAGCSCVQIGVESGSDIVLKSMRKGTTKEMVRDAYRNTRDSGIIVLSGLIFGDVKETSATVEESFDFAMELTKINPRNQILSNVISLYPGSPLYDYAKSIGKIKDTTKHILNKIPIVNLSDIPDKEFIFLEKRIVKAMERYFFTASTIACQNDSGVSIFRIADKDVFEKSYAYLRFSGIDAGEKTYFMSYACPKCNTVFYQSQWTPLKTSPEARKNDKIPQTSEGR